MACAGLTAFGVDARLPAPEGADADADGSPFLLKRGEERGWKGVYMEPELDRANMRRGVTRAARGVELAERGVGFTDDRADPRPAPFGSGARWSDGSDCACAAAVRGLGSRDPRGLGSTDVDGDGAPDRGVARGLGSRDRGDRGDVSGDRELPTPPRGSCDALRRDLRRASVNGSADAPESRRPVDAGDPPRLRFAPPGELGREPPPRPRFAAAAGELGRPDGDGGVFGRGSSRDPRARRADDCGDAAPVM